VCREPQQQRSDGKDRPSLNDPAEAQQVGQEGNRQRPERDAQELHGRHPRANAATKGRAGSTTNVIA